MIVSVCALFMSPSRSFAADKTAEKVAERTGADVLSYFHQVYPKDSDLVAGLKFETQDLKNGYLKATGNMEGYYVFALFKGAGADVMIEQGVGCGPECRQSFKAHVSTLR